MERYIGWSAHTFEHVGLNVWKAPKDTIVGNFYMINQRLYTVACVSDRNEDYSIVELLENKAKGIDQIEMALGVFYQDLQMLKTKAEGL